MNQRKISLLVVLYNKDFENSSTLQSLLNFKNQVENLYIVNNGPNELDQNCEFISQLIEKHCNVEIKTYLENKPLSWIYNDFIKKYASDFYVFFDDDTAIDDIFVKKLFSLSDVDIELPKIIAKNGVQYYPIVNKKIYKDNGKITFDTDIYSIGSGLILSKKIVNIFLENKLEVFDSRFALYGVDVSFFRVLNKYFKNTNINIFSNTVLHHSLSRTEGEISDWRAKERLYDTVLSIKYYSKYPYLNMLKIMLKQILKGNFKNVGIVFNIYKLGCHPRCWNKNDK